MDGLDLLIADHNRVRGLFTRFRDAHENSELMEQIPGRSTMTREDLVATIDPR